MKNLREMFVWAYERSCARYAAIRQSLGEPDPFRPRLRKALQKAVGEVVRRGLDKTAAVAFLRDFVADQVATGDRDPFLELAESELAVFTKGTS